MDVTNPGLVNIADQVIGNPSPNSESPSPVTPSPILANLDTNTSSDGVLPTPTRQSSIVSVDSGGIVRAIGNEGVQGGDVRWMTFANEATIQHLSPAPAGSSSIWTHSDGNGTWVAALATVGFQYIPMGYLPGVLIDVWKLIGPPGE